MFAASSVGPEAPKRRRVTTKRTPCLAKRLSNPFLPCALFGLERLEPSDILVMILESAMSDIPSSTADAGHIPAVPLIAEVASKLTAILVVVATLLGIATTLIGIYGYKQELAIKREIADNADVLEKAKAEKAVAESKAAAALAENARIKQAAESKYSQQKALVEAATARFAERIKRAEADKQSAVAISAAEIARNADVKFKAEAEKATLEALEIEHKANIELWLANCAAREGPGGQDQLVDCSKRWSCMPGAGGALC